jgi:hypothetical protein
MIMPTTEAAWEDQIMQLPPQPHIQIRYRPDLL